MPSIGCEHCDGSGYIRKKKEPIGFDFDWCACLVEYESLKETIHNWKVSGLPNKLMVRYSVEDWTPEMGIDVTLKSLITIIDDAKLWLFISGPTGSGKTYL